MNAPAYNLNPELAREGDSQGSMKITENGAYPGIITKAKHIVAGTGAIGVEFGFEAANGATGFFTLYTKNKNGESIFGEKQLMALMTCMKVKSLKPQQAQIEEFDFESRSMVKNTATIYPDLMNKPVGIVFQKEYYVSNQGDNKERMNFYTCFDPTTKQTANEVLDQAPAERLEKILANLKDKNSPPTSGSFANAAKPQTQAAPQSAPSQDSFDDDIPF